VDETLRYDPLASPQRLVDAASGCRASLIHQGIDPAAFNTTETAGDVNDIRRALGYARLDLLGVSYGTTAALVTLRKFPDAVRTVILDGVVPPDIDVFDPSTMSADQQQAFKQFLGDCAADPVCGNVYPDLADTFTQLEGGDDETVSIQFTGPDGAATTAHISRRVVANMLKYLMDDPAVNALIPEAATSALAGNGGPLGLIASRYVIRRAAEDKQAAIMSWVVYDAVTCSDFPSGTPLGGRQVCDALGVAYGSQVSAPVASNAPVLLLSGAYDERTPPGLAEAASQTLPNSRLEVFPATGHGIYQFPQAAACAAVVVRSFLEHPNVQPDDRCVAQVRGPQWQVSGV
jgi:pimeloyl-ACP methyl ester carboxylesterase